MAGNSAAVLVVEVVVVEVVVEEVIDTKNTEWVEMAVLRSTEAVVVRTNSVSSKLSELEAAVSRDFVVVAGKGTGSEKVMQEKLVGEVPSRSYSSEAAKAERIAMVEEDRK